MTEQSLNQLLKQLIQIDTLKVENIESALDIKLNEIDQNPVATIYEFKLDHSILERGEIRLHNSGDWAIVILHTPADTTLTEDELELESWGEIKYLDVKPDVPPEGLVSYTYTSNGVLLTYHFHGTSRTLATVELEWGEPE
jgi:hypothetical protein